MAEIGLARLNLEFELGLDPAAAKKLTYRGRAVAADLAAMATDEAMQPVVATTLDQLPQPNAKGGDGDRQKKLHERNKIVKATYVASDVEARVRMLASATIVANLIFYFQRVALRSQARGAPLARGIARGGAPAHRLARRVAARGHGERDSANTYYVTHYSSK